MTMRIQRTNCHFCGYCCAFLAYVEDGRVTRIEPDVSRFPYDEHVLASCRRWRMNPESLYAPNRINFPLRRTGERGSGHWERVSWDEALDDIAMRLRTLAQAHGPETLASAIGGPHASYWPLHRFMNAFGSPNNMGIGQICWNPRIWMDAITFGWTIEPDIVPGLTTCVFLWGTNPAESDNSLFWRQILQLGKAGVPLVVIDPRRTRSAAHADLWLPVRPGTDCTLALGIAQVIIEEGLANHEFIDAWCHGFDEFAAHVRSYTPERVARECDVPAEDIRQAARLLAKAPAALISGRGIDQCGANVAPTHRAICCLRAITGNVDRRGSCALNEASDFVSEAAMERPDLLSPMQRNKSLNCGKTPLQSPAGYDAVRALTEKKGRTLPQRYLTSAHPHFVLRAIEAGDPYPVRALIVEATNPLLTYADTNRVLRALTSLDLLVVLEYHMTPTASLADYVLPAAGAVERPIMQIHGGVANIAYGGPAAVPPYEERKTDFDIFRELGLRLGQESAWPEHSLEEAFEWQLAPAGMSWDDFCLIGAYGRPVTFGKHELIRADGTPAGFATTTGKIELASELLESLGGQRLPSPAQPRSLCTQLKADAQTKQQEKPCAEEASTQGAFVQLITGARKQPYNASMYFENENFRASSPAPCADMSATTAQLVGVGEGDTVLLRTDYGQALFKVHLLPMRDNLISADYGWWHPEWPAGLPNLGGCLESNVNCLTSCEPGEPLIGTWSYNAVDCFAAPAKRVLSWDKNEPYKGAPSQNTLGVGEKASEKTLASASHPKGTQLA